MSLLVVAGLVAVGALSACAYRYWRKASGDDDDVEVGDARLLQVWYSSMCMQW